MHDRCASLVDGLATYEHYWYGGGADFELDYDEAYFEDEAIRENVDKEVAIAQTAAEELHAATGLTSFEMSVRVLPDRGVQQDFRRAGLPHVEAHL